MTDASASKMRPALISGAILGIASGIPFVSCGCCLYLIGGGVLASYLYLKDSTYKVSYGDSAVLGLLTGLFGLLVATLVGLPFRLLFRMGASDMQQTLDQMRDQDVPPEVLDMLRTISEMGVLFEILIGLLIFPVLAMVGSLIGQAVFQKESRSVPGPPAASDTVPSTPPPPSGGTAGGSGSAGAPPSSGPPPAGGGAAPPSSAPPSGGAAAPGAPSPPAADEPPEDKSDS